MSRPTISLRLDTDVTGNVVKETDPEKRKTLVVRVGDRIHGELGEPPA